MKLLGNKDLRKGRVTRQEVHCLGTWTWTRGWGEPSEEVPRWAVGADLLVWQGESCIDCNKEMATFIILRKCCPFTKIFRLTITFLFQGPRRSGHLSLWSVYCPCRLCLLWPSRSFFQLHEVIIEKLQKMRFFIEF